MASRAALRMAGPNTVLEAGSVLLGAIMSASGATDVWHRNLRAPSRDNAWQPANENAQDARESFTDTTKKELLPIGGGAACNAEYKSERDNRKGRATKASNSL